MKKFDEEIFKPEINRFEVQPTFHTCKADCRTIRAVSDLPMYSPASTLFRLSPPRQRIIACWEVSVPKLSSSPALSVDILPVTPES